MASKSSKANSTPMRPAMAMRWSTKLVEPPTAALRTMAFSNASRTNTLDKVRFSRAISTMRIPERWAIAFLRESAAGMAEAPGKVRPKASDMTAMVEAVPMVAQWPMLRFMQDSASSNSSALILPVLKSSLKRHTSVPEPMTRP